MSCILCSHTVEHDLVNEQQQRHVRRLLVPVVKNPPASAGDVRDVVLIPGLGRSPG